jgi:hypothetical protein
MCCKRRTQPLPTQRNPTPRTHPALLLQALAEELKVRPMDLVQRYRELGCVDVAVTATTPEGGRTRGYRITLMPPSAEQKTLGDYFPALKLGAKKR